LGLQHAMGLGVSAVIGTGPELAQEVRRTRPDLVVVDGLTDDGRALQQLSEIRTAAAGALVLVVLATATAEQKARLLEAEAVAWVWPGAEDRFSERPRGAGHVRHPRLAGRAAAAAPPGPAKLTRRERETLAWVANGHTNAWIARRLWVTEQTVKFHLTNIYRKLGVSNRTEAAHYAVGHGLVSPADGEVDLPDAIGIPDEPTAADVHMLVR
jgi:DNA-binding NarL/FixJ family response regulator